MEICSRFTGMERKDGAFLLHTDNADIKVCFVTDEIVRVRASFDHELAEESYVLMTTAWEDRMDELFKGERTRVEPFAAQVTEDDSTLTFATGKVTLVVDKDPINFKLLAADGSELYSTLPGNPFVKDANNRGYGFLVGQRVSNLPKEQRKAMTDPNGWTSVSRDLKFKAVPFKKKGFVNGALEEVDCTLVLTFSEARKKRDLHELDAAVEYAQRCVNEKAEMPESRRYWTELVETSSKENRAVQLKQKIIDARRERCGYAGIVYRNPPSGKTELTPEEIVHAYHDLVQIEDCFKIMKSNLNLRPMFLRTPLRIQGHILICVLSLIVLRLLARRLRGMENPLPINRIIEGMEDAKVIAVHSGDSEEWFYIRAGEESGLYRDSDKLTVEELAIRHRTSLSDTAAVLAAAGLEMPPVFCDRNKLAKAIRTKFKSDADAVPAVVYRSAEMEREDALKQAS